MQAKWASSMIKQLFEQIERFKIFYAPHHSCGKSAALTKHERSRYPTLHSNRFDYIMKIYTPFTIHRSQIAFLLGTLIYMAETLYSISQELRRSAFHIEMSFNFFRSLFGNDKIISRPRVL